MLNFNRANRKALTWPTAAAEVRVPFDARHEFDRWKQADTSSAFTSHRRGSVARHGGGHDAVRATKAGIVCEAAVIAGKRVACESAMHLQDVL